MCYMCILLTSGYCETCCKVGGRCGIATRLPHHPFSFLLLCVVCCFLFFFLFIPLSCILYHIQVLQCVHACIRSCIHALRRWYLWFVSCLIFRANALFFVCSLSDVSGYLGMTVLTIPSEVEASQLRCPERARSRWPFSSPLRRSWIPSHIFSGSWAYL